MSSKRMISIDRLKELAPEAYKQLKAERFDEDRLKECPAIYFIEETGKPDADGKIIVHTPIGEQRCEVLHALTHGAICLNMYGIKIYARYHFNDSNIPEDVLKEL